MALCMTGIPMRNDDLAAWNAEIERVRLMKVDAMEKAIRSRGVSRRVALISARMFAWVEKLGRKWRHDNMMDD